MTIKKRLLVSNILMIVIPVIVSIATVTVIILVLDLFTGGMAKEILQSKREVITVQGSNNPPRLIIVLIFIFICFCFIMFFTSRFFSKAVIKRIEQPLEMLSDGVQQISEGNLNYKITYDGNDEFKPICESFNNMADQLKTSIDEVQKNEQNRKELLASISHDIRSPLTSIKGFVEGLIDGVANTPESQQEYLQIIKQKTDDINNMVSQLFYYSKMDMGNYPTNPEKLNVAKEIKDFVFASLEDYKEKGLLIEISGMTSDKFVYADPLQLRSIFANILDNSSKYREKDTARALINCVEEDGYIRITFEDDGPGVLEHDLIKMFDVFYRGDPSRSNSHAGSGLGLAIASKALERMNGRIYAENINKGGLRLIVEIPEMKEAN